jgi:hypothetical protein
MKIKSSTKWYLPILVSVSIILSVLADPNRFSVFVYNVVPIRLFLPLITIIGFLLFVTKEKLFLLFKDRIFLSLLAFTSFTAFSFFYTQDLTEFVALIAFYTNLIGFYLVLFLVKNKVPNQLSTFDKTYFYTLLVTNVLSLINFFYHWYIYTYKGYWGSLRVVSTITDENHYALYLIIGLFIIMYLILTKFNRYSFVSYSLLSFSSVIFFALKSRSGFLALITSCFVFIFLTKKLNRKALYKSIAVIFISLVLGYFVFKPFESTGTVYYTEYGKEDIVSSRYSSRKVVIKTYQKKYFWFDETIEKHLPEFLSEASIKSHLALIYSSAVIGFNYPLFGVGAGSFNEALVQTGLINLYARYDPQAAGSGSFPVHTMYGQALAEGGFVGLGLYLLVLFFILRRFILLYKYAADDKNTILASSFIAIFSGYLVFSMFYNVHEEWFWVPLILGLFLVKTKGLKTQKTKRTPR